MTQAIASLTFPFGSVNMLTKLAKPGIITSIYLALSGPSVIAPKDSKAEYLFFQSGDYMFADTN